MSKAQKQITNWDHFTGQWLRTVRALRRDANYCRLALAMARADEHRQDWGYYLSLAQTWKGIHDDRDHVSMQTRCAVWRANGWCINVTPAGEWLAEAPGIESRQARLSTILDFVERTGQPLREQWSERWAAYEAKKQVNL